ncbi:MAG: hypothetical protein HC837_00040 [Chloroflexaceae bacterium]|nr:hypothetical protein [Chloroflexaceae bacterium]
MLGVIGWYCLRRRRYLLLIVGGIILAAWIRVWMGVILSFPLLIIIWCSLRWKVSRLMFFTLGCIGFVLVFQLFAERFSITSLDRLPQVASILIRRFTKGESAQEVDVTFTSITDMLLFFPFGAFSALFRPLLGEVRNAFGMLAGMENAMLLVLAFLAMLRLRWSHLRQPIILWAGLLIITWASFYAFVSPYNLGTATRYRVPILIILLFLLLYLTKVSPHPSHQTAPQERIKYQDRNSMLPSLAATCIATASTDVAKD